MCFAWEDVPRRSKRVDVFWGVLGVVFFFFGGGLGGREREGFGWFLLVEAFFKK